MNKLVKSILFASPLVLLLGCASVRSPIMGVFYTGTKSPLIATSSTLDESKKKVGEAECKVILGFAIGDCSIETAIKDAGIKKIHHVDSESTNVLGIFGSYKVIVTGE